MRTISKALSLAGLAARGRNAVSGEVASENSIKSGKACLVLVAADASGNTQKKFTDSCRYYGVPVRLTADRESLGKAVGKDFRSTVVIEDAGLAAAILKELEQESFHEKEG